MECTNLPALRRLLVIAFCLWAGCTADVLPGQGAPDTGGKPPTDNPSGTGGAKGSQGNADLEFTTTQSYPLMRLTVAQHTHIAMDVLGVNNVTTAALVKADPTDQNVGIPDLLAGYQSWAEKVSQAAVGPGGKLATFCGSDEATCGTRLVSTFGPALFRRPVNADETTQFAKVFSESKELGTELALTATLQAMLMSPSFTMVVEAPVGSTKRIAPHQLAARLALALWDSAPDAELMAAASAGNLSSATDIDKAVQRMILSPKFARFAERLFEGWMGYAKVASVDKDAALKPVFTPAVAQAMAQETQRFTTQVFNSPNSDFRELLTSTRSFVNRDLANIYGLTGNFGSDLVLTEMTGPGPRAGLLTQGSMLATLGLPTRGSVVMRGVHILERFLCSPPPPPPDVPDLPAQGADRPTQRERLAEHRKSPTCASCHKNIDGAGLAFEVFDAIGRYAPVENGVRLTGEGELPEDITGPRQPYADVRELATILSARQDVKYCFLNHWFAHSFSRKPIKADVPALGKMASRFVQTNNMRELLTAFVTSESFQTFR